MAMDVDYAHRRSMWLDLKLMLKTPFAVFRADGAC
jgi:lipopolysaccharide/colanic/teichoic acid biosynthesis glycosyltransferase